MSIQAYERTTITWCLAAFQAAGILYIFIVTAYPGGSLGTTLGGNGNNPWATVAGLGAFAALWFASWFGTRLALREIPSAYELTRLGRILVGGFIGGAVSGALFLTLVVIGGGIAAALMALGEGISIKDLLNGVGLAFVLGLLGAAFAAVVGAVVGSAVALIEFGLLRIAVAVAGTDGAPDTAANAA